TNILGWRMVFLGIAILATCAFILVVTFIDPLPEERVMPLRTQMKALGNLKIGGAHLATLFMLAGHYTFYAYFTPFLETTLHLSQNWISITYFIFGIAAVSGGALGGTLADKFGVQRTILFVIGSLSVLLSVFPYTSFSCPFFLLIMMLWGAFIWALAPPLQEYFIKTVPVT